MDPNELVGAANAWITALVTVIGAVAVLAITLAKLYASTRRKLHTIIQAVEASPDAAPVKRAVKRANADAGVDIDGDIHAATGRLTRRLRREQIGGAP